MATAATNKEWSCNNDPPGLGWFIKASEIEALFDDAVGYKVEPFSLIDDAEIAWATPIERRSSKSLAES